MSNQANIVEKLSQFNNMSFTKKQWDIILKGCGCPKSASFWTALRQVALTKNSRIYTMSGISTELFNKIWNKYSEINTSSVQKCYKKREAIKKAQERREHFKSFTLYMVGGVLTTEKPERD